MRQLFRFRKTVTCALLLAPLVRVEGVRVSSLPPRSHLPRDWACLLYNKIKFALRQRPWPIAPGIRDNLPVSASCASAVWKPFVDEASSPWAAAVQPKMALSKSCWASALLAEYHGDCSARPQLFPRVLRRHSAVAPLNGERRKLYIYFPITNPRDTSGGRTDPCRHAITKIPPSR